MWIGKETDDVQRSLNPSWYLARYGAGIGAGMELALGQVWSWHWGGYGAGIEAGMELALRQVWSWHWGGYGAGKFVSGIQTSGV